MPGQPQQPSGALGCDGWGSDTPLSCLCASSLGLVSSPRKDPPLLGGGDTAGLPPWGVQSGKEAGNVTLLFGLNNRSL